MCLNPVAISQNNLLEPVCSLTMCTKRIIFYLDVSVETDGGVIGALQAFERHWTLLFVVDEEDEDPTGEVQQNSYCSSFSDATVRPAQTQTQTGKLNEQQRCAQRKHPADHLNFTAEEIKRTLALYL